MKCINLFVLACFFISTAIGDESHDMSEIKPLQIEEEYAEQAQLFKMVAKQTILQRDHCRAAELYTEAASSYKAAVDGDSAIETYKLAAIRYESCANAAVRHLKHDQAAWFFTMAAASYKAAKQYDTADRNEILAHESDVLFNRKFPTRVPWAQRVLQLPKQTLLEMKEYDPKTPLAEQATSMRGSGNFFKATIMSGLAGKEHERLAKEALANHKQNDAIWHFDMAAWLYEAGGESIKAMDARILADGIYATLEQKRQNAQKNECYLGECHSIST